MNGKTVLTGFTMILLSSVFGTLSITSTSASTTHRVYPGQLIQEAINLAQPGDTIYVYNGTYYEHVVLDKSIWLVGQNQSTTIIDGGGTGAVVTVTQDRVGISGFTIQNGGSYHAGIYLNNVNHCNITENNIANNEWEAVHLYASSDNSISENNIANNRYGICLKYSSDHNSIFGTNITNNRYGLWLSSSSNNKFYHNNLINNTLHVYDASWGCPVCDPSINVWDDGYPSGGNYWSNYTGVDVYSGPNQNETDSDGIQDIPYVIDENNQDNYPLMNPWVKIPEGEVPNPPFWMQWWFWAIVIAGIGVLAGAVYFLKRRKPPTPTAPTNIQN